MGVIIGAVERTAEPLTITLDGLITARTQISTQYSYSGDTSGIYPTRGWLDITLKPAVDPEAGDLSIFIVPGAAGVPVNSWSAVDATITTFTNTEQARCLYVGTLIHTDLDTNASQHRFFIGPGGIVRVANSNEAFGMLSDYSNNDVLHAELPRYWSLAVRNASAQTLAASGNSATFTPVFGFEVGG